jgi:hypothetical protein
MGAMKIFSCFKCLALTGLLVLLGGAAFIYSGIYPMGSDVPHNRLTYWVLETVRERSFARASRDIQVPTNLDSSERLLSGGADYNDMCSGCHLKPGKTQSDLTLGLYPAPPNLAEIHNVHGGDGKAQDRRRFWIIKHGIKASGMPAWGPGHDDERIWNMVAFLRRLPELSPDQYQILTARESTDSPE